MLYALQRGCTKDRFSEASDGFVRKERSFMPAEDHSNHDWIAPKLFSRSGKQLFFCGRCAVFRPSPDKGPCILPGNLTAYDFGAVPPNDPLPAREVVRRLVEALASKYDP